MPRVICNLPNASTEISGVKFHPLDDGGLVSDEIDAELAATFLSIPGYESYDAPVPEPVKVEPATPPAPRTRKAAAPKKAEEPPKAPEAPAAVEQDTAPAAPAAPQEPQEGADEVF